MDLLPLFVMEIFKMMGNAQNKSTVREIKGIGEILTIHRGKIDSPTPYLLRPTKKPPQRLARSLEAH